MIAADRTPLLTSYFLTHRAVDNRLIYVRNVEAEGSSPFTSTEESPGQGAEGGSSP